MVVAAVTMVLITVVEVVFRAEYLSSSVGAPLKKCFQVAVITKVWRAVRCEGQDTWSRRSAPVLNHTVTTSLLMKGRLSAPLK